MAAKVEADPLYSRLNARGRKELKPSGKNALAERFSDYAGLGLPAHKAAMDGNIECLKEVYRSMHNDGVPSRDVNGATALHLAVRNNKVEAVRWLVQFTDLSTLTKAKHDETPFHVAAALGHTASLKALLSAETKGDIKSQVARSNDNSGFTALNLAIVKNNNEAAKILISELGTKGVCPSEEGGVTSAHIAASAGNVDVLKMIARKHKKLLSQKDSDGTTPSYFAAQEGRLEALKYLHKVTNSDLSEGEKGLKPIHAACQLGHTHIVKYIVACQGNAAIFQKTADDATPLHYAASAGQTRTARWLVNSDISGTLINAKDVNGDTAAHDAADNGQTEALNFLLESGADLYAVNNDGNTPYSVAVSGPHHETANFVMTYASKSPQKSDLEEPSQMTIFDLQQGSVDVVDIATDANNQQQEEMEQNKTMAQTAGNKGPSFHKAKQHTLQSFQREQQDVQTRGSAGERVLHMTDAELALFDTSESKRSPMSDEIVVRYSGADEHRSSSKSGNYSSEVAPSDYATVNELAISEERKDKKRSRKITKSIQSALKPKRKVADAPKHAKPDNEAFKGPEMGFKPQFRSNPLQQLQVGSGVSTPPTPPPTPATASVLSDEVHQRAIEVEDDDTPYDMHVYAKRDPEVIKQKAMVKKQEESENTKLLEDALDDLFDDALPPSVPDRSTDYSETDDQKDSSKEQPVTAMPSVLRKWPPANATKESEVQRKPEVNRESAGPPSVLRKWPMTERSEPKVTQSAAQPKPSVTSKWPPARKSEPERAAEQPAEETMQPDPEPEAEHSTKDKEAPSTEVFQRAVALKPAKKAAKTGDTQNTELTHIKLKKPSDGKRAIYSHPESEDTSGADPELKKLLLKRKPT